MNKFYTAIFLFTSSTLFAQPVLKPTIGLSSLPADNTAICTIACGSYNFNTSGLQLADTIPQFQFYTTTGTPYDAQSLLNQGKPLCIIVGSYTCPVWRTKITNLNSLVASYGTQVNFLVVYVVEAHPQSPDISPYSCNVWNPTQNVTDGVMYYQPTTYGARKQIVTDMMNNSCTCMPTINAPIIIDGPCNTFWTTFGPAPNNAYLVDPRDGTVNCKHGWYDQSPNDMNACIASLLNTLSVDDASLLARSSVYPNPFTETTTIQLTGGNWSITSLSIRITDVTGREIMANAERTTNGFILSKNKMDAGIYFYTILNNGTEISNGKILVN